MILIHKSIKWLLTKTQLFYSRYRVAAIRKAQQDNQITQSSYPSEVRRILVDVSIISRNDAKTGIQRVVRALFSQLLKNQVSGSYVVCAIAATKRLPYRIVDWPNCSSAQQTSPAINVRPGDIYLGLDLCTRIVPARQKQLAEWQRMGVTLNFVVYDLLPLHHPEWFPKNTNSYFKRWLDTLAALANQVICISPHVEGEFNQYIVEHYRLSKNLISVKTIPMGCDIASTQPSNGLPKDFHITLEQLRKHESVLMVGTIEPRKGHEQVINAFETIWNTGNNLRLVLVGRPGWKTDVLQRRLKTHPEINKRLFWLDDASDEALEILYKTCKGVLIASRAEGFGLPLIEALGYGKPVLVRGLPVFQQNANNCITYFDSFDSSNLAGDIQKWTGNFKEDDKSQAFECVRSGGTWDEAAKLLTEMLITNRNIDKKEVECW